MDEQRFRDWILGILGSNTNRRLNADNEISAIFQEQQVTGPHGETFDIVIRTNDRSIQLYIQREDLRQAISFENANNLNETQLRNLISRIGLLLTQNGNFRLEMSGRPRNNDFEITPL